jgi:type I restriction enzyme S subunit
MNKYPERPLGDALVHVRQRTPVADSQSYRITGVYSFGKGLIKRDAIQGSETTYKFMTPLSTGQLVMSKLNAWEGALAIVTSDFDGSYVSPEYPIFNINQECADVNYIRHLASWPPLWERLTPRGSMVRRKRTTPETLLATAAPLPDRNEQRRIADALDILLRKADATVVASESQIALADRVLGSLIQSVFGNGMINGWKIRPLGEIAEINPRSEPPLAGIRVAFVPMASVNAVTGSIEAVEYKDASSIGTGYKRFCRGDVIFARITPCMQNGKFSVFDDPIADVGYGSSEFHVIRPIDPQFSEWIHRYVRSKDFRDHAVLLMTGTAGQQRVPASYLREATIPMPQDSVELQSALSCLRRIENKSLQLRLHRLKQRETLKALRTSILNAAFTGRL